MIRSLFVFSLSLIFLDTYSQTRSFSSDNIDSLLVSQKSHPRVSLENAYCLDAITRYYTLVEFDTLKAEEFIEEYENVARQLDSDDILIRSSYRKAHYSFIISGTKELDADAFIDAYTLLKEKGESTTIISSMLANYTFKRDDVSSWYDDGTDIRLWLEISGDDYVMDLNYKRAVRQYILANYQYSSDDSESVKRTCYKAMDAVDAGGVNPARLDVTVPKMIYVLFSDNDTVQFREYKKRVLQYGSDYLTSELELAENEYREEFDLHEPSEVARRAAIRKKETDRFNKLVESSIGATLEPGIYYADYYGDYDTTMVTLTLKSNSFHSSHPDENNYQIDLTHIYRLNDSTQVLCGEGDEGKDAWVLLRNADRASIKHTSYVNFSLSVDSAVFRFIEDDLYDSYTESVSPSFIQYYSKERYDQLNKLPHLPDSLTSVIRDELLLSLGKDSAWYYEVLMFNYYRESTFDVDLLREILISKGYNPFQGLYFLNAKARKIVLEKKQAEFEEDFGFLGHAFSIVIIAKYLFNIFIVVFPLYLVYYLARRKKLQSKYSDPSINKTSGDRAFSLVNYFVIILSATVLFGIGIGMLGFELSPNRGPGDLRPPIFGFIGMVLGGIFGFIGSLIYVIRRSRKAKKK